MDNQQETIKAYLAGILDGEGCIHVSFQSKRGIRSSYGSIHHIVQIANTSKPLVDFLSDWLAQCEIPFHVCWTRPKGPNQKLYAQVRITRYGGIKKFLTLLLPYLLVKKSQAELMLEFTEARLKIAKETQGRMRSSRYTERDFQIIEEMKVLNQRGIGPSTTTRQTLLKTPLKELRRDDIVSSRVETHELR